MGPAGGPEPGAERSGARPAARVLPGGADEQSLRTVVAASRSWRAVLRSLQLSAPRDGRRLREACDGWGIDYSHFGSRAWTDDQLRRALGDAAGWHDLLVVLGYPEDSGSARATVRKHAARLHLDVTRFGAPPAPSPADPFRRSADRENLRYAGAYLVAGACALLGHRVSWPLEPAAYDLVVDAGSLLRVQVKTTTWRSDGEWACKVTHAQSGRKAWYTDAEIDYFGIVDGDLQVFMVPVAVLAGLGTVVVRHYDAFRLPSPTSG